MTARRLAIAGAHPTDVVAGVLAEVAVVVDLGAVTVGPAAVATTLGQPSPALMAEVRVETEVAVGVERELNAGVPHRNPLRLEERPSGTGTLAKSQAPLRDRALALAPLPDFSVQEQGQEHLVGQYHRF